MSVTLYWSTLTVCVLCPMCQLHWPWLVDFGSGCVFCVPCVSNTGLGRSTLAVGVCIVPHVSVTLDLAGGLWQWACWCPICRLHWPWLVDFGSWCVLCYHMSVMLALER